MGERAVYPDGIEMPKAKNRGLEVCDVCGKEVLKVFRCYDCGKAYCPECAEKNPTVKELGICPDCEEVFGAEEDYWGWEGGEGQQTLARRANVRG